MISAGRLTSGSTSGSTDTDDDDGGSFSTTSDPFSGNTSGGLTGSEIMAEGGSATSVVTSDPHTDSMEEKIEEDGLSYTLNQFQDMAHDSDDGDTATFDHVPNTEEGRDALRDSVEGVVSTAQDVASSGPSGETPDNGSGQPDLPTALSLLPFDMPTPDIGLPDVGRKKAVAGAAVVLGLLVGGS